EEPVNLINAPALAREQGLVVEEQRRTGGGTFANEVEVTLATQAGARAVRGTVLGGAPRLVGVDGYPIEVKLEGHLLFYQNEDRPGMLATVGTLLADAGVALTVVTTAEPISPPVVRAVGARAGLRDVRRAMV